MQRRGRASAPLGAPASLPTVEEGLSTPPEGLVDYFRALAAACHYTLGTEDTLLRLKAALYAFALDPQHSTLLYAQRPSTLTPGFTLAATQEDEPTPSSVCGHLFKQGESVYRCRDCTIDPTCVLCARCFHASSHATHDVTLATHSGSGAGCCDCGDHEAFLPDADSNCKFHPRDPLDAAPAPESDDVQALKADVEHTLRILLDWMIHVFTDSPTEMVSPRTVEEIALLHPQTPASSSGQPLSPLEAPVYPSETSRGKARESSPSAVAPASPTFAGPWSVVLWNDEKHSFVTVIDQVCRATGVSKREAAAVAQRVDTHGRDVIYISSDLPQLLFAARLIANIDLGVTIRPAIDTFNEQVAGEIVKFLRDIAAARVNGEGGVLAGVLAKVLLEAAEPRGSSRFQRLVGVDSRLWKEPRVGLAELYVALLMVSKDVKTELSVQFARIYMNVAESYLLTDREPENSIITLGVQVFTVPSVSALLVSEHHFLNDIIAVLYSYFTEQLDQPSGKHLLLPPNPAIHRIDPESAAFKQKRYFQIFGDLIHLISSPAVQSLIRTTPLAINEFAAFLDLFTSMNSNKRAVRDHVEYESDTWVTAFNVTIQLGKICRSFGEAFRAASSAELARGLSTLLVRMAGPRTKFHAVEFGGTWYQLLDFRVENEDVSFHHPLAWLFAEMCKNVEALDGTSLREIGIGSLSEIALARAGQLDFLAAMDHPLRVIVLVAQIRAGLWVRNGFGMRAQHIHYREYSLRENTFDQDIYFLQTALVILDPSLILVAILDRFHVQGWLAGVPTHPTYDDTQAFAMMEEMVYLLIVLLSDPTHVANLSSQQCLRRELIHHLLCLGPCKYSDLMRRVSEKFSDDPKLDRVLEEVANFKQPMGNADQGTYTLKKEFYREVDPYFSRFTRNQREEAENLVREHMRSETGEAEPVIVPVALDVKVGPFVGLTKTFNSDVLHQIIFFTLEHGRKRGALFSETLVDSALHLSLLALIEQPESFSRFASERVLSQIEDQKTLVHLLVKLEGDERMKSVRHKVRWCLDRLTLLVGPSVSALRKVEDTVSPANELDVKRLAAKARQAAILRQFAAAQASFLASSENIDDEDEDEDEMMGGPSGETREEERCIVCQEGLDSSRAFGSLAFVQTSCLVRHTTDHDPAQPDYCLQEVLETPSSLDRDASALRPFGNAGRRIPVNVTGDGLSKGFPQSATYGLHASACGHLMHLECFETYYHSIEQRHLAQPTRCHPETIERFEFLCPLCKSLGNVLLPRLEEPSGKPEHDDAGALGLDEWYSRASMSVEMSREDTVGAPPGAYPVHDLKLRSFTAEGGIPSDMQGLQPWETTGRRPLRRSPVPSATTHGNELMITRLMDVSSALLKELGRSSLKHHPGFLPHELISYTLSCIEIVSRGASDTSAASSVPDATMAMLQSFLEILGHLVGLETDSNGASLAGPATLAVLPYLGGVFTPLTKHETLSEIDPLAALISIAAVNPSAFGPVASLGFYTELLRKFLSLDSFGDTHVQLGEVEDESLRGEYLALAGMRELWRRTDAQGQSTVLLPQLDDLTLGKLLYSYTLPFLRRAAILHRVVFTSTDSPFPDDSSSSEFSRLLNKLGILEPAYALGSISTASDPLNDGRRAIQAHLAALLPDGTTGPALSAMDTPPEHPTIYELLGLPLQLDTLTAVSLTRECERCHQVPTEAALCLLCGEIVCNQSFCCMDGEEEAHHGECNVHMWTCGGSVGIYFLIKKNAILYLYTDRGTLSIPPYLDAHGEDSGTRRNQFPQFLHMGRYDEIRKAWLQHGIPTLVARKLDATVDYGGWETM